MGNACACLDERHTSTQNTLLLSSRGDHMTEKEGNLEDIQFAEVNRIGMISKHPDNRQETRASKIEMFGEFNELDEFTIPVIFNF